MRCKPDSCSSCPIIGHGTDFSKVEGTGSLGVLICAEARGEMEARDQLPLRPYAPSGSVLERTFKRMGYSRQQFSITNCIRCRPARNFLSGAPWEFSALTHCRPNLDAAIRDRRPRAILALGDTALRELTGEAGEARGVSHLCGYVLPGPDGVGLGARANNTELLEDTGMGRSSSGLLALSHAVPVIPTYPPS